MGLEVREMTCYLDVTINFFILGIKCSHRCIKVHSNQTSHLINSKTYWSTKSQKEG